MARVTDYASLKAAVVINAMRTGDVEYEAAVDGFIQAAESRLNRSLPLRAMRKAEALTGAAGTPTLPLPDDYVEPYVLHRTTGGTASQMSPMIDDQMSPLPLVGTPTRWAIDGDVIMLDRACDRQHNFSFTYRKSFCLSDAEPKNWLLNNHPDVYIAATLVWGGAAQMDGESTARWAQFLDNAIDEISWKEARGIALAPLRIDPALTRSSAFNITTG